MSASLSGEKWNRLVDTVHTFTQGRAKPLWEWLRMAGQINWALNVYPWLRLILAELYAKITRKSQMWGKIKMNKTVQRELMWFIEHIEWLCRIFFFKSMVCRDGDVGHSMLTIHIDTSAQGLGIWFTSDKLGYQCWLPTRAPTNTIFFFEALTVCSVVHLADHFTRVAHLLITTDNMNTLDIFTSLNVDYPYNPILISTVDIILRWDVDLRIIYTPGPLNHIADALSWYHNTLINILVPGIWIKSFIPPQDVMGAEKNDFHHHNI